MTIRIGARFAAIAILALLAVLALVEVLRSTPEGLGLSDDSIGYIAGARSMLAGQGYREAWLASNGPVTHFPPAYPSVLVLLGWFGLEPLRGARFLNAVLFSLNTVGLGILGWRMTKSLPAGLMLAVLFVINDSLLRIHSNALSEPLFIFLGLMAFWMFDLYFERDTHGLWLVACGFFVGAAYLTRYAALGLAVVFVIALLVLHNSWRKRAIGIGVFMASLIPWIAGWAIRNAAQGGTVANRVLAWHPITARDLETALRTASAFLMPVEPLRTYLVKTTGVLLVLVLLILGAILVWILLQVYKQYSRPKPTAGGTIAFTAAVYIFSYLTSVLVAMSFFDASTKFKERILAPAYVPLLVLLVALGTWTWSKRRELVIILGLAIVSLSSYGQVNALAELERGGQGYASFKWYDSKAMEYLRDLPPDQMIYTNEPGAVYLYTNRGAYVLPDRVDPVTAEFRLGFEQGVDQMQADVISGRAVLALFSGGDAPNPDLALLSSGLYLTHKSAGAEVYAAAP